MLSSDGRTLGRRQGDEGRQPGRGALQRVRERSAHLDDRQGGGAAAGRRVHDARPVAAHDATTRQAPSRRPSRHTARSCCASPPTRKWAANPPAVELGLNGSPLVEAGTHRAADDDGHRSGPHARQAGSPRRSPARRAGRSRPLSPTGSATVPTGKALTTRWQVTPPAGTATGTYDLTLSAQYRSPTGTRVRSSVPLPGPCGGGATGGQQLSQRSAAALRRPTAGGRSRRTPATARATRATAIR